MLALNLGELLPVQIFKQFVVIIYNGKSDSHSLKLFPCLSHSFISLQSAAYLLADGFYQFSPRAPYVLSFFKL